MTLAVDRAVKPQHKQAKLYFSVADCKHYIEFEQIKLDEERYRLDPVQDPTGNILTCASLLHCFVTYKTVG